MLSNCKKCLWLARIGRPDILWPMNKLARSITKWTTACDKRLNRLLSYIHHTYECKQYCFVGDTAKQCRLGLFQDSDFAGDLEDSKSTSGGTLCVLEVIHLVQSVGCVRNKLQFHTVQQNPKSSLWTLDWDWTGFLLSSYGIWLFLFLEARLRLQRERCVLLSLTEVKDLKGKPTCWTTLIVFPQTSNLRIKRLCCMCLKTTKQWSRWSLKEGVTQWPTELRLIGCSIELTWTQKSKSSTSTPITNFLTSSPKEVSHVMSGIICCACSISPKRWRNDLNAIQEKNESQQNRDQRWILMQGRRRTYHPRLQ